MTTYEATQLKPNDRLIDTRDGELSTVLSVNETSLRVRYDDSESSNYIDTRGCAHLMMLDAFTDELR